MLILLRSTRSWKPWWLLVAALSLVGSACSSGSAETDAAATPTRTPGFTLVHVHYDHSDLMSLLRDEVRKAQALGQKPFVLFSASWCLSCRKLEESLDTPLMKDAFEGTYIINLDIDEWDPYLGGTGFRVEGLPKFFRLNDQGRPKPHPLDGSAWEQDTPGYMAPVLKAFFGEWASTAQPRSGWQSPLAF